MIFIKYPKIQWLIFYLTIINNEQYLNDFTNSNMNMNMTTNNNLFNNDLEDDMDIYPNFPRSSFGKSNNLNQDNSNINNF